MNLDGTTLTAIFGFLGLVVTTVGGVFVATKANKSEKEDTAKAALEETKDEAYEARLVLRDEQIKAKDDQISELHEQLTFRNEQIETLKSSHDRDTRDCRLRIEELEAENDELYRRIKQLEGQQT